MASRAVKPIHKRRGFSWLLASPQQRCLAYSSSCSSTHLRGACRCRCLKALPRGTRRRPLLGGQPCSFLRSARGKSKTTARSRARRRDEGQEAGGAWPSALQTQKNKKDKDGTQEAEVPNQSAAAEYFPTSLVQPAPCIAQTCPGITTHCNSMQCIQCRMVEFFLQRGDAPNTRRQRLCCR